MSINQINPNSTPKIDPKVTEMKKAQNMFFKLLTTQLQCQDIENTVDMNQMTQQIFQMHELQTLMEIKHQLHDMNHNLESNGAANMASNIVGKYAMTKTNEIAVSHDHEVLPISYIINGNNSQNNKAEVKINFLNHNNQLVHQVNLSDIKMNEMQNFNLQLRNQDGSLSMPEGIYKVQVLAHDKKSNLELTSEIYNVNKIQQVMNNGDFILNNNQNITMSDIIAIQAKPLPLLYNPYNKQEMKINDLIIG